MAKPICAVVWDFDQTLADTRTRNLNVTRKIIAAVTGRPASSFAALASVDTYFEAQHRTHNWREFYMDTFDMDLETANRAGAMWTRYQLEDATPVTFFPEIEAVLAAFAGVPQGIFSQNSRANIQRDLRVAGLDRHFAAVIGYEEVGFHRQKPCPDGLLLCLDALLDRTARCVLYIGDSDADLVCAVNSKAVMAERGQATEIISVGAAYGATAPWRHEPDFHAPSPGQILDLVATLTGD